MWFSSSSLKAKRTSFCDLCTQHLRNYLRCANNSTVEATIVENNSVIAWCLIIANKIIKSRRPGCVTRSKMAASTVEFFARLKTAFQKVAIVNSLRSQNKIIVHHYLINALQKLNEKWHGFWKLSFFNDKDGLKFKCMNWLREAIRFYTKRFTCIEKRFNFFHRPDVDFDVRLMRAVQVMDIPMLKDFINALVMDSLTYGNIQLSRSHYLNKLVYREKKSRRSELWILSWHSDFFCLF